MSGRDGYVAGAPCWVDTLQPDPATALEFYGGLFGWTFDGPGPGGYHVAHLDARAVAGVGALPADAPTAAAWATYVRVDGVEAAVERATRAGGTLLFGPLDALPAGRLAVLVDPAGAPFCVWEPRARAGAQLVNEPGTWMMSSLHTPEPAAASTFYGALFGWQPEPLEELTLYRLAGHSGGEPGRALPRDVVAVMAPTGGDGSPDAIPPHWNVNFRVTDADATAERAAALGGTVIAAPQDTPGFRSAVLGDPAGAAFSVSQLVA